MSVATMTVLFCDVVGSTELRTRLGDDSADFINATLTAALSEAVEDAGGTVVKTLGDGLMAVFGSTVAAAVTGAELQRCTWRIARRDPSIGLQLRVGMSVGEVAGHDGDWHGIPAVEAARLCAAAEPGQVLAADVVRVLSGSRGSLRFEPVGDLLLKGLADPLSTVSISWEPPTEQDEADRALVAFPAALDSARRQVFVGRDLEVQRIVSGWKNNEWRALLIAGEPGAGKTRLAAEVAELAAEQGAAVLLGRCDEDLVVSLRPWNEALDPLVMHLDEAVLRAHIERRGGDLVRLAPMLRRRVADVAAPAAGDPAFELAMACDALVDLLRDVSAQVPVVIVVDDIHSADRPSLTVLRQLTNASIDGVSLIATYRDTDVDRTLPLGEMLADLRRMPGVERIALKGLDDVAVVEFLEAAAGHELDDASRALARTIHQETSGNPLFIGEILRHLAESGALVQSNDQWQAASPDALVMPEGLREVVGRRLTALGPEANESLRIAAVLGRRFELDVVEAVLGGDRLISLEAAERAAIVFAVDDLGTYEFRHAVLRQSLLDELPATRRARLHRDVAVALERRWVSSIDRHLDELAHHHAAAGTTTAPAWCARAAAAASEQGRFEDALSYVDRGLDRLALVDIADQDPEQRCDLLIARSHAIAATRPTEALAAMRVAFDAARALGDGIRMADVFKMFIYGSAAEVDTERPAMLRETIALLPHGTSRRVALEGALLLLEWRHPELERADAVARIHEMNARTVGHDDDGLGALRYQQSTAANNASVALDAGEPRLALSLVADLPEAGSGMPTSRLKAVASLQLGRRDDFDSYMSEFASTNELRPRMGPVGFHQYFECLRMLLDGAFGEVDQQVAAIRATAVGEPNFELVCITQLGWRDVEIGQASEQADSIAQLISFLPDFPVLRAQLAWLLAEAGRVGEARDLLDELAPDDFAAVGRGHLSSAGFACLAYAAIATASVHHAAVLRRLLQPWAGQALIVAGATHVIASCDRMLAGLTHLLDEHDNADRLFATALIFEEDGLRSPPLAARTRHWWARALIERGEHQRAEPLLTDSRTTAARLGMVGLVAQLDTLINQP